MKTYTFDEICDSQDFSHNEEFVLQKDYDKLKELLLEIYEEDRFNSDYISLKLVNKVANILRSNHGL